MNITVWNFQKNNESTLIPNTLGTDVAVRLKEPTDVLSPVFTLSKSNYNFNFIKATLYGVERYYHVDSSKSLTNDIVEIICSHDLLATIKGWLDTQTSLHVERAESDTLYSKKDYYRLQTDTERQPLNKDFTTMAGLGGCGFRFNGANNTDRWCLVGLKGPEVFDSDVHDADCVISTGYCVNANAFAYRGSTAYYLCHYGEIESNLFALYTAFATHTNATPSSALENAEKFTKIFNFIVSNMILLPSWDIVKTVGGVDYHYFAPFLNDGGTGDYEVTAREVEVFFQNSLLDSNDLKIKLNVYSNYPVKVTMLNYVSMRAKNGLVSSGVHYASVDLPMHPQCDFVVGSTHYCREWLNTNRFTSLKIHFPYAGEIEIPLEELDASVHVSDEVWKKTIRLYYEIDLISPTIQFRIADSSGTHIAKITRRFGYKMSDAVSGQNADIAGTLLSSLSSLAFGSAGFLATAGATVMNVAQQSKHQSLQLGAASSDDDVDFASMTQLELVMSYNYVEPEFPHYVGRPINDDVDFTDSSNNLNGYIKLSNFHCDSTKLTRPEKDKLKSMVEAGFYYE